MKHPADYEPCEVTQKAAAMMEEYHQQKQQSHGVRSHSAPHRGKQLAALRERVAEHFAQATHGKGELAQVHPWIQEYCVEHNDPELFEKYQSNMQDLNRKREEFRANPQVHLQAPQLTEADLDALEYRSDSPVAADNPHGRRPAQGVHSVKALIGRVSGSGCGQVL